MISFKIFAKWQPPEAHWRTWWLTSQLCNRASKKSLKLAMLRQLACPVRSDVQSPELWLVSLKCLRDAWWRWWGMFFCKNCATICLCKIGGIRNLNRSNLGPPKAVLNRAGFCLGTSSMAWEKSIEAPNESKATSMNRNDFLLPPVPQLSFFLSRTLLSYPKSRLL